MPSLDPVLKRSNHRAESSHPFTSPPHKTLSKVEKEKSLERNIDTVLFGDILFKSWYPSWYPKEVLGEKALSGDGQGIVVEKLCVCSRCFAYSKVVADYLVHRRRCDVALPGERVYVHPAGDGPTGVWSVWVVDGGRDAIFAQNLSLFAKLFLDNKSVFYDVSSFFYYLLVNTSPTTGAKQVVGFFSKEKLSWDSNNLACILVFPPWQRKGLGMVLMGVSYEISRKEGILGGPEKPISELGRKGYRRFWGAEIARWLLEHKETGKKKGRGIVTVEDVSQGTWIVAEDCLAVMREMGVVESLGSGKDEAESVKIDKVKLREWAEKERLDLRRTVDPQGFLNGYGHNKQNSEEDEAMEGDEE